MIGAIGDFLWSYVLVVMLVGMGLWFTVASRFVQFRFFGRMFRSLARGVHHEDNHVSSFQALVVSVAGRVGGGNIAGGSGRHYPGRARRCVLDVVDWPDGHGHQFLRVFAGAALKARRT